MTNYRRSDIAGASYFFTLNLADRSQSLLTENIALLRSAFEYTRGRHPFAIDAIVILPDHLHAIWTLPEGDSDFALRWRLIKTVFSRALPHGERRSSIREDRGERGIWSKAILGAPSPRRRGFLAPCRLHPYQSGQAWLGIAGGQVAAFVVPSFHAGGRFAA